MLTGFQNLYTDRFSGEYATQSSLIIPPQVKRVAALPCETSTSENYRKFDACIVITLSLQSTQGSVATRFRCDGLFSNYRFIVEFGSQTIFKICEHLAKLQARSY